MDSTHLVHYQLYTAGRWGREDWLIAYTIQDFPKKTLYRCIDKCLQTPCPLPAFIIFQCSGDLWRESWSLSLFPRSLNTNGLVMKLNYPPSFSLTAPCDGVPTNNNRQTLHSMPLESTTVPMLIVQKMSVGQSTTLDKTQINYWMDCKDIHSPQSFEINYDLSWHLLDGFSRNLVYTFTIAYCSEGTILTFFIP